MARQCAIIPQVLNPNGEKVDSKLFTDLLSFLSNNRAQAVRLYQVTKNPEFINKWNPKLVLDENGEPTIKSLLDKTNISTYITERDILNKLNKDVGAYKRGTTEPVLVEATPSNRESIENKAIDFNTKSEYKDTHVAKITSQVEEKTGKPMLGIQVEKRNRTNSLEADQMETNSKLNKRIREILTAHGISIGALTELEEKLRINGVTDFEVAKTTAEGLIELIRLAKGERGEKALPEEFAHFVVRAMSSQPLMQRLINLIATKGLAKEIIGDTYDEYAEEYNNSEARLAEEAAGKLLAKHLLQTQEVPAKPYKNLLQRVFSLIKNFFNKLSATEVQKAIRQADKHFSILARDILDGSIDEELSIDNLSGGGKLYNLSERVARDQKLLQNIIDKELKRLTIYEKRNSSSTFNTKQQQFINELTSKLAAHNEIEGIYSFLDNALDTLKQLDNRLVSLQAPGVTTQEKASVLRDIRNYLYSYRGTLSDIRSAALDERKLTDDRYGDRAKESLKETENLLDDLFEEYRKTAMPLFIDFLKPFVGEGIVVPFGKWKGRVFTAEDLATRAEEDISFFDRWLDSMADSSNYTLKIFDQAVKKAKELARFDTIDLAKEIKSAGLKLEAAGYKSFDWMFEKYSNGDLSGNYISEINHALFKEKMREMYKELERKYGKNPVGQAAQDYNNERRAWFAANMEVVNGIRRPKMSIYASKEFASLSAPQKEFYDTIMEIKAKLDSYLPARYTTLTNAVKIRKDLLERVKSSPDIKSGTKQIWENIKDQFIRRSDDIDLSDKAALEDFEGNKVQMLPIYYTKLKKGESANDMSTDVVSTMIAYAAMANDFHQMNKIIDVLETCRDLMRDKFDIVRTEGEKPLKEKFSNMGRKVENILLKPKDDKRIIQRLNDYFEMQVYSRYMADEGTFGKSNIDKAKVANFVNRMTSLNTLALNVLSGVSNVATGRVMMRIESFSKQFYGEKDTIKADRIYAQAMPAFLAELGNRVKTSKLALWSEYFNVLQEYETDVRETNFDRKTWFSRMANTSALFFMNNAGEHWMQHRTSLALANTYKMKAPDGKIVSLWDAMEVVPIDKSNPKLGAKLQVKEGYTKKDGTEFTREDAIKFSRKTTAINQRMHGIYNKLDRSAVQRLAIGRMGVMFRKWIKPSLNRRFKSASYNYDLDDWAEGYYRTTGRFLWQLIKELKEQKFNIVANWKNLHRVEKANIKRAITEVGHFLAIALVLGLMDWGDDKDRPWLTKMIEYQTRRLYTEIGVLVPGPQMAKEGLRIIKSPAAGVNTLEQTLNLAGLFNPFNYETFGGEDAILQSGRYEGESRAVKLFYESPIIPMNKTIWRSLHPEEGIPFFKQ